MYRQFFVWKIAFYGDYKKLFLFGKSILSDKRGVFLRKINETSFSSVKKRFFWGWAK